MLPSIVIGLGGTGKWVLTDLKRSILEASEGVMPDNVVLLAFDLEAQGSPRIERSVFNFEEGKEKKFTLDYSSDNTPEFYNFSDFWAQPIFDIEEGRGQQRKFIYRWLREDDAKGYSLSASELHSKDGAGQRRQTSRVSLFLHSGNIYQKIYQAVLKVGGGLAGQNMHVFLVSSLAGGTGSGIFTDICYLLYKAVAERGREATPLCLYGFFILPKGFEAVAAKRVDRQLMEGNCFAAFRELQRFMSLTTVPIDHSGELQGLNTGGVRLFDICYFTDGAIVAGESGAGVAHYRGTCPALADFILLHMKEGMAPTTENRNLITHIGAQVRNAENPFEAQIYSTFGIYKYIFDVEEIKKSFAHRLASEVLFHFIDLSPKGETEIKSEVQDFMKSPTITPFNRDCVNYLLEHPGAIRPRKEVLFNYMKFGSRDEDIPLPALYLEDITTRGLARKVPFEQVEKAAQVRLATKLGNEGDEASPRSAVSRSCYGVLNHYHKAHQEKFKELLKEEVVKILRQNNGRGSLDHTHKFLGLLAEDYKTFVERIRQAYEKEDVEEKIRKANERMAECKAKNDQKGYLDAVKSFSDHRQHQLVIDYVIKIAESHQKLCDNFQEQISVWIETFKLGEEYVSGALRELNSVRRNDKGIKIHEYVTDPDDKWENKLYEFIFGRVEPRDEVEKALNRKLPHPDISTILGTFRWVFTEDDLTCTLPAEFAPWQELRERPIQWNYNFVNNFLEKGQLHAISNLSILDILVWEGVNPDDFARDICTNSVPLAVFSSAEQLRGSIGEGDQRVTSDWMKTFAKWSVDEPGGSFAQGLQDKFVDRPGHDNPHQIIQYQARHFIRMRGFSNLLPTEKAYRQGVVKKDPAPLHVFLAEKNAAKYEEKLKEILNEEVRCLHPVVVNLLEHEERAKDFTYAVVYKIIPWKTIKGRFCYAYEVEITGQRKQVILGENLLEAILSFTSVDREAEKVREKVKRKVVELKDQKASAPKDFADELKQQFNGLKIDDGSSLAEKDLIRVMKIILWEEATYYGKVAERQARNYQV